jgi:hypothetical protein
MQPKLLLPVHGGQSFLKKQQQNFMLTMKESMVETQVLLLDFSQECQLLLTVWRIIKMRAAMIDFGNLS